MSPHVDGQLDIVSGVSNPLKTTSIRRVRSPALHPRNIQLSISQVETSAMNTRSKLTWQRNDGALQLSGDFVTKHQEMGTCSE